MKRRFRAAVTVTALVTAAVLIPAVGAGASTARPWLTATPATGLRPGQIISLAGAGFGGKGEVLFTECPHLATLFEQCSFASRTAGTLVAGGRVKGTLQVLRRPWGLRGRDCAVRFACEIGAVVFGRGGPAVVAEANIWFDSTGLPIMPHFTVSPSTNLAPNQMVTVKATGLEPGSIFRLTECNGLPKSAVNIFQYCAFNYDGQGGGGPPPFRPAAKLPGSIGPFFVSAEGSVEVQVRANANVLLQFRRESVANCEVAPGCEIAAQVEDAADPGYRPQVALGFNPVAKPITPVMTVSQTSGLADGQMVKVTGGPFIPDQTVMVRECPTSTPIWEGCSFDDITFAEANAEGDVTALFPVVENSGGSKNLDCATVGCSISILGSNDVWYSAWTPIEFDSALPPIRPEMTVTPASDLDNGSLVTVAGSGFQPGAGIFVQECLVKRGFCVQLDNTPTADNAGGFTVGASVSSTVPLFNPSSGQVTEVPCGTSGCELSTENDNDPQQSAATVLSFAG